MLTLYGEAFGNATVTVNGCDGVLDFDVEASAFGEEELMQAPMVATEQRRSVLEVFSWVRPSRCSNGVVLLAVSLLGVAKLACVKRPRV